MISLDGRFDRPRRGQQAAVGIGVATACGGLAATHADGSDRQLTSMSERWRKLSLCLARAGERHRSSVNDDGGACLSRHASVGINPHRLQSRSVCRQPSAWLDLALERALGNVLLKPEGRRLVLAEAGRAAMRRAEQIFALGEQLPGVERDAVSSPSVRLAVGTSDGVPKLVVRSLLKPVLAESRLRLLCHEGEFDDLLAELALYRLDVVLWDRAAAPSAALKVHSRVLGSSELAWYAPPSLAAAAKRGFPQSLTKVPVLLPTRARRGAQPAGPVVRAAGSSAKGGQRVRGQRALEDVGAGGMGGFPAVRLIDNDLLDSYAVKLVGACGGVEERFFAIAVHRKVQHPLVLCPLDG